MIQDKQKVEKIYNYLSALSKADKSSSNEYRGWSQYDKGEKKKCYSVQLYYRYDESCKNMSVELYDIDFNYKNNFWSDDQNYKRIYIGIRIAKDFSELEIKECMIRENSDLFGFFKKLDKALENYNGYETLLTQILLSKVEGE